ncbi:phage antirepressor N-terminal domain-containing protein [Providencia rettgeri]|nr:phage antirepressor N-terminal domain-containing protein [Providencia rettgeri]
MNTISTINVPFHGNNLYVVNYNGEPHVPMKPIVEGMGLDWKSQFSKIKSRFSKGMVEITIPTKGGEQSMICLALRKLAGWLHTISPNKVKPEIRDKVIQYQEECDDVLYEYWTTGEVKAKHKSTVQERNPLKNAVNLLVSKKGIMYPEAYSLVHQQFNVSGIDELTADQIPMAVEYIHKLVMEGEYIPKQDSLPTPKLEIDYPLTWYPDNHPFVKTGYCSDGKMQLNRKVLVDTRSPVKSILCKLIEHGYDVSAAMFEIDALRHLMSESYWAMAEIQRLSEVRDNAQLTIRMS